jgi:hypothetical protein
MSNYRRILVFACALILFGASARMIQAASVTLRAPAVEGTAGRTVDVPIQAAGASGLGAVHVEVVYDPALLKAEAVTNGTLAGATALVEGNVNKPGRVVIGIVAPDSINGDGVVANVRFQVIGNAGQSSMLTLEKGAAWERTSYAEVLVQTEAGKVTIAAGWPWWLILAAIAVLIILLLILFFARRRRSAAQPAYAMAAQSPSAPNFDARVPPPTDVPGRSAAPLVDSPETRTAATPSDTSKRAEVEQAGVAQGNYCTHCGQPNKPGARFCRNCGQLMETE